MPTTNKYTYNFWIDRLLKSFLLIALFLLISGAAQAENPLLKVHFIDVGQADCILLELPDGESMLIDAGNNDDGNMVVDYIKKQKIETIDYLVGTHPHEDHIGGLDNVINSFKIGKIYMPEVINNTRTFEDVLLAIKKKGKKVIPARAAVNIINEENLKLYFLSPIYDKYDEINNYSAVVKLEYKDVSFLFTGDAERINEEEMLSAYKKDLNADVLKVAHHGSNSSSSIKFLAAVKPEYAIISVGKDNNYGHPSEVVLKRLRESGIETYRTDLQGTVIASSDGKRISFNTEPFENKGKEIHDVGVTIDVVDLRGETVRIKNNTDKDIDLSNWKLLSVNGEQEFIFPDNTIIKAEDYLTIASGNWANSSAKQTIIWTRSYIWNNNGDIAELYNQDNLLVAQY